MSVNWQAYLDGSLGREERRAAEEALANSQSARNQLENLIAFRGEIRRSALEAEVPIASLQGMLREIGKKPVTRKPRLRAGFVLVAAVALLAALYISLLPRPVPDTNIATNSPAEAARWISEQTGLKANAQAISSGKLIMAEAGDGWGCFCWSVDGQITHVAFRRDDAQIRGLSRKMRGGREYFVGKGIGFHSGGLTYYVHGGREETRWKVVQEIS